MPTAEKKKLEKRKILITGHGRGATKYAAALARCMGVKIRHEGGIGKKVDVGKSSWYEAHPPARLFDYEYLILIVRDPWKVAVSASNTLKSRTVRLREKICGAMAYKNAIDRNARLVICWYRMILNQKPDLILKAEKCERKLLSWFKENGFVSKNVKYITIKHCLPPKTVNRKPGSGKTGLVPWSRAEKLLSPRVYEEMRKMREFWDGIT